MVQQNSNPSKYSVRTVSHYTIPPPIIMDINTLRK